VRDEYEARARLLEIQHYSRDDLELVMLEPVGYFIEDDDLWGVHQDTDDIDKILFLYRQCGSVFGRIKGDTVFLKK
jgi:hypothetical protein